jgi:hypothetical protein
MISFNIAPVVNNPSQKWFNGLTVASVCRTNRHAP